MNSPFNSTAVHLDAEKHGLDEDGVVFIRNQFPVKSALEFSKFAQIDEETQEVEVDASQIPPDVFLRAAVSGWEIKASGVSLLYVSGDEMEMPTSVFEEIMEAAPTLPLALRSTGASSSSTSANGITARDESPT